MLARQESYELNYTSSPWINILNRITRDYSPDDQDNGISNHFFFTCGTLQNPLSCIFSCEWYYEIIVDGNLYSMFTEMSMEGGSCLGCVKLTIRANHHKAQDKMS